LAADAGAGGGESGDADHVRRKVLGIQSIYEGDNGIKMRKRNIIGLFFLLCFVHAFSEEDDEKKVFVPTPEASMTVGEFERIERPFKASYSIQIDQPLARKHIVEWMELTVLDLELIELAYRNMKTLWEDLSNYEVMVESKSADDDRMDVTFMSILPLDPRYRSRRSSPNDHPAYTYTMSRRSKGVYSMTLNI
jgi:hypothetical protein